MNRLILFIFIILLGSGIALAAKTSIHHQHVALVSSSTTPSPVPSSHNLLSFLNSALGSKPETHPTANPTSTINSGPSSIPLINPTTLSNSTIDTIKNVTPSPKATPPSTPIVITTQPSQTPDITSTPTPTPSSLPTCTINDQCGAQPSSPEIWVEIGMKQCVSDTHHDPWGKNWQSSPPDTNSDLNYPIASPEKKFIANYYQKLGLTIYDITGEHYAVSPQSCAAPTGIVQLLINSKDADTFFKEGFTLMTQIQ